LEGRRATQIVPFCVSKQTPNLLPAKPPPVNWRNFQVACKLAQNSAVDTAMLTGKGEPTLWPDLVSSYIMQLDHRFPLVELQTNGLATAREKLYYGSEIYSTQDTVLHDWYNHGLTTIALSVVHWDKEMNKQIYCPDREHFDINKMVDYLHSFGFSVRLTCMLLNGYIDSAAKVREMVSFSKECKAEQLTIIPINSPVDSKNTEIFNWVSEHRVPNETIANISNALETNGHLLMELGHGAKVYDVEGQNVCLNYCLGTKPITDKSVMRNLIFHPDGHLRYDWQYEGSIIL
jgi:molybdenum cofactor biosynthesis enzyme MoaA